MTNSQDAFKQAFTPFTEAFKSLQNLEVPETTRDFVKRAADTAKEKTAEVQAGAERITSALEAAATDSLTEATKIARGIQAAIAQDTETFFAGLDRLVSAKSVNEAVQVQTDYLRAQGETLTNRTKSATEYLASWVTQSAKTAQDNFAKAYNKTA